MKYYANKSNTQKGVHQDEWNNEYPIAIIHYGELEAACTLCKQKN